jgi:hypothetical protein
MTIIQSVREPLSQRERQQSGSSRRRRRRNDRPPVLLPFGQARRQEGPSSRYQRAPSRGIEIAGWERRCWHVATQHRVARSTSGDDELDGLSLMVASRKQMVPRQGLPSGEGRPPVQVAVLTYPPIALVHWRAPNSPGGIVRHRGVLLSAQAGAPRTHRADPNRAAVLRAARRPAPAREPLPARAARQLDCTILDEGRRMLI